MYDERVEFLLDKRLKSILKKVEKPARYTGGEYGSVVKDKSGVDVRYAFCFPDSYEIGMSNLGMRILTGVLNEMDGVWCERCFAPWPDMRRQLEQSGIPLYALESGDPLYEFDFIGFTLQYELCYTNVLTMLSLGGVPLYAAERKNSDPIVMCGGPCAYNIEPMAEFFDIVAVGEGEELLPELVELYRQCGGRERDRAEFLKKAAQIEGIYVPSLYEFEYDASGKIKRISATPGAPDKIRKRIVKDLDGAFFPTRYPVPSMEVVQNRDAIELYRGCIRGCRFCQAGHTFRPIRQKSPETLARQAIECLKFSGADELALISLSTSDYKELPRLCDMLLSYCEKENINLSVPSLRADNFSTELTKRIGGMRKSSITFAPEAGTQRLRDVINKNLTEQEILSACKILFESGWSSVKLYFMLGLPTEEKEDIEAISALADSVVHTYRTSRKVSGTTKGLRITLSTSLFIPKPFTPFQRERMCTIEEMNGKVEILKKKITARAVTYNYHDPRQSMLEGVFARGDRRLSRVVVDAWRDGCGFDSWDEHFKFATWLGAFEKNGVDPNWYLREIGQDEVLPWSVIDCGISGEYLNRGREDARRAKTLADCRREPGGCAGCGAKSLLNGGKCDV